MTDTTPQSPFGAPAFGTPQGAPVELEKPAPEPLLLDDNVDPADGGDQEVEKAGPSKGYAAYDNVLERFATGVHPTEDAARDAAGDKVPVGHTFEVCEV